MLLSGAIEKETMQMSTHRLLTDELNIIENLPSEEQEEEPLRIILKQKYFDQKSTGTSQFMTKLKIKDLSPILSSSTNSSEPKRITLDSRAAVNCTTELD